MLYRESPSLNMSNDSYIIHLFGHIDVRCQNTKKKCKNNKLDLITQIIQDQYLFFFSLYLAKQTVLQYV